MVKHLLDCCAIGLRALLCAGLCTFAAMVLSACGPGTGGTGTGPNAGASPTTFTSSYFTTAGGGTLTTAPLPNPSTTPTATPSAPATTCTANCANPLDGQALSLHLQANRIELSSACASFTYAGPWSISAAGETTVQGVLESTLTTNSQASRTTQSASLTLGFVGSIESSASVSVRITDSAGKLLLGPVTLLRASGAPSAVAATGC